jgi:geranylgeranyl reductase family protein
VAIDANGRAADLDVVVVGAGPAGATAALYLARSGRRVALIEKEALPRYKTCGGGVVGRALRALPDDVEIPVEQACFVAEANFLESRLAFRVERDVPIVSMTMRSDLDQALANAAATSGARILAPCALLDLRQDGTGVDLETSRGPMRAGFVVAADGVLSTVARRVGWRHAPRTIPALEIEARVPPEVHARFAGTARFDFQAMEAGYGWVFPKREHLSCGILTMRRGASGLHEALARYLARVGVSPVLSEERHGYLIPVGPRRGGFARGRILLAGDAAGFADALTGEGISLAIASGKLAAEAILDGDPGRVRRAYRRALRREILGELRVGRALAWIAYRNPTWLSALLRRRGRSFCERLTDVFLGERSYRSLVLRPSSYANLVRAREHDGAHVDLN